jgi:hypothetical protein
MVLMVVPALYGVVRDLRNMYEALKSNEGAASADAYPSRDYVRTSMKADQWIERLKKYSPPPR